MDRTIGVLHPGEMGASLGAAAAAGGAEVVWCDDGRSDATRGRADAEGLQRVDDLRALVDASDLIISICPPAAAVGVASAVAALGFGGLYLDANAVSPETARDIEGVVTAGGARFIDGGVVGPPARSAGGTILYLSGTDAGEVASAFEESVLEAQVVGERAGEASAVKMAFAAWTKGSAALLLAVRALAEGEGVSEGLLHAWSRFGPDLDDRARATAAATGPKAWRFTGEMEEIADTFEAAGLPSGFHRAAAEIYQRMVPFKERRGGLDAVLSALLGSEA